MKTPILTAALLAALAAPALAEGHRDRDRGRGPNPMKMLEQADSDGDGAVTMAEIEAFRAARFAQMDANGDGGVDAEEAAAFHAEERKDEMTRRARVFVAKRDNDNDGKISAEEMGEGRMARMFERIDRNDDGQIDAEEMRKAARKMRRQRGRGDH